MSKALKKCQRKDGFWNVSLHDETNFGGKETSGTALFVYGMAWGVRKGLLDKKRVPSGIAESLERNGTGCCSSKRLFGLCTGNRKGT